METASGLAAPPASLDAPETAFVGVLSRDGTVIEAEAGVFGRPLWETCAWLRSPDARRGLRNAVARAAGGERVHWDAPAGATVVRFELVPLRAGDGQVVKLLCRCEDVTARRLAEARTRERDERMLAALEASQAGTYRWDLRDDSVEQDESIRRLIGGPPIRSVEDFLARLHPGDRERLQGALRRCNETGADLDLEYRIIGPDGHVRWLADRGRMVCDEAGSPLYMTGVCIDVTQRKETESRLSLAMETAGIASFNWNLIDDTVEVTETWRTLFGLGGNGRVPTYEEWLGLLHPDDRRRFADDVSNALAGAPYRSEYRMVRPCGEVRWLSAQGLVERGVDDRPVRLYGMVADVTERRRWVEQLREAQEIAELGRWEFDVATGRIAWSDEVFRLFDRDPRQGPPSFEELRDLLHPDDRARFDALVRAAVDDGKGFDAEWRVRRPDGTHRWKRTRARAYRDATGNVARIVGTDIDVNDRKEAEQALRASEERLRAVVETAVDGIITIEARGEIVTANSAVERLFGYGREELVGRNVRMLMPEPYRSEHDGYLARYHATGERRVIGIGREVTGQRKDGSTFPMYLSVGSFEHGGRTFFTGILGDLTERNRQEEALRESERQFERLANSIPQLAWMARPDGAIYWYNERWFDYTGTTLEEMRDDGWKKVHHPDHLERVLRRLQHSWDTGVPWEDTFPLRGRDGGYRWFLSRARPVRDANGRVVRWFGTNTDVTEQRHAEEALRELADQREALLKEAHHRIKNSIASVASLLHLQANTLASDGERAPLLDAMQRVQTIGRIHEALYRSDRYDAIDIGAHLHAIMADLAGTVSTRSGRTPSVCVQCPAGVRLPAETVTPLSLIAVELVLNAVKHADTEGELTVEVIFESGSPMCLAVSDNGPGMPAGAETGIHGLGLRLVRSLARQLGGHLTFEGHAPGTRACVRFPYRFP